MDNLMFLKVCVTAVTLAIDVVLLFGPMAQAQIFPTSYYYTNPLYYSGYGLIIRSMHIVHLISI